MILGLYIGISHKGPTLVGRGTSNKSPETNPLKDSKWPDSKVRIFKGHTNFVMCSLVIGGKRWWVLGDKSKGGDDFVQGFAFPSYQV